MTTFLAVLVVLGLVYLLLRANALWVYRLFDRSRRNDRSILAWTYEVPRYYALKADGTLDKNKRWPGWDGWYFFLLPDDPDLPIKMVRASLMTGLYGLEGIDTYSKLSPGMDPYQAVEYLILAPSEGTVSGRRGRQTYLGQFYLPKATYLTMETQALDLTVASAGRETAGEKLFGRMRGAWPHYSFQFAIPQAGIDLELTYHGENLIWWADFPGLFTYVVTFGKFAGMLTWTGASGPESYAVTGKGGFEHGFGRKPSNFDILWTPVKWLQKIVPALRPIHYHYELLVGDGSFHGGFMYVRGFGIIWRNRGGLYLDGIYQELDSVEVEYFPEPAPDVVEAGPGEPPVRFYRRWRIKGQTRRGVMEYEGQREWPPAHIANHMAYYYFTYTGTYQGEPISGRGYGEYVRM